MPRLLKPLAAWLDHRTGLNTAVTRFLSEEIPRSAGWPHVFGSVTLFLVLVQALTGILLALNYAPTEADAYSSVTYIMRSVAGGRLMHGLHHWGASFLIVVVFLHMAQVFIFGAFKRPREATWIAGVFLLLLMLAFALTGYLLPWDNRAYWGTLVTTRIMAGIPLIGPALTRLAGAENGIGEITFSRFYTLHTVVLPATAAILIFVHVCLVRRHGIAPGKRLLDATQTFYPAQLFRDLCAVFIAFLGLFLGACFLDVPLERIADAADTAYVPRPEWYFLFLFQLLKIFPGRLELIGTAILPSFAILTLLLLPFLHRTHAKVLRGRIQSSAAVALVFSLWIGLTGAAEWNTPRPNRTTSASARETEGNQIPADVLAGRGYFKSRQCESCHNVVAGLPKPGPTLGLGKIGRPREWIAQHLNDQRLQRDAKPPAALSPSERNAVLAFVEAVNPEYFQTLTAVSSSSVNGAQVLTANSCLMCHKVNGSGGDVGPSLNGLSDRRDEAWVRQHFTSPAKLSPGSIMPPYRFNANDERDLIDYLLSLSE